MLDKVIFLSPLVILLLAFISLKVFKWVKQYRLCNYITTVTVVDILTKEPKRGTNLLKKPIYKGICNKESFVITSAKYTSLQDFEIGQECKIRLNPRATQEFLLDKPFRNVELIADCIGCLIPIVMLLVLVCTI